MGGPQSYLSWQRKQEKRHQQNASSRSSRGHWRLSNRQASSDGSGPPEEPACSHRRGWPHWPSGTRVFPVTQAQGSSGSSGGHGRGARAGSQVPEQVLAAQHEGASQTRDVQAPQADRSVFQTGWGERWMERPAEQAADQMGRPGTGSSWQLVSPTHCSGRPGEVQTEPSRGGDASLNPILGAASGLRGPPVT